MSTQKANHYLQVLDAARCNGDWDAVPEWRRKVEKHAPGRRCSPPPPSYLIVKLPHITRPRLALTALTEARVHQQPPPPPNAPQTTRLAYQAALTTLQEPLLEEVNKNPNPPKLPPPAGGNQSGVVTHEDILQARVTIAWICTLKGEWDEALGIVPGEDEVGEGWGAATGKGDYIGVVRIKALVLKGLALSHKTPIDLSLPLQLYRTATRLSASYPPNLQSTTSFLQWHEKALSYYALTAYRCWLEEHKSSLPTRKYAHSTIGLDDDSAPQTPHRSTHEDQVGVAIGKTIIDEATVASAFRAFHTFVLGLCPPPSTPGLPTTPATVPATEKGLTAEKEADRREVYRHFFKFLSLLLLPKGHPERPRQKPLPSSPQTKQDSIAVVLNGAGKSSGTPETKAGTKEQLKEELRTVETLYENYLLKGLKFPRAEEYHEAIGEWVDQVVENWRVDGGSTETAGPVVEILYRASTKTFHSPRILRHLFSTLTATGNFGDAILAFNTYLELVQKAKDRISKGHTEKDFDGDQVILETGSEGIRVICKHVGDGKRAIEIAELLEWWIEEWRVNDAEVLGNVYRGIGIANATWSRQTVEGENRAEIQKAAEKAFVKGLSYDQTDIDAWYNLALLQAEMRDVDAARDSAKNGLLALKYEAGDEEGDPKWVGRHSYRRRAAPLLHLLALLMSAQEEFDGAERACANVFEIIGDSRDAIAAMGVSEKEGVLEVKMTQIAIFEAMESAEAAIPMTDELLGLFGRLYEGIHLNTISTAPSDPEEPSRVDSMASSRPTTASRRSRLLGRGLRKQFTSSAASLPAPQTSGGDSINGGTLRRRPKSGHKSLNQPTGLTASPPNSTAPRIRVTEANGGGAISEKWSGGALRPNSVSGGTIRRADSLGSFQSLSTTANGDIDKKDDSSTPPFPSSVDTTVSLEQSPAGSVKEYRMSHPQLFHTLKSKLHHQNQEDGSPQQFGTGTTIAAVDGIAESAIGKSSPKAENIPNNLPRNSLPYPLRALGNTITDERDGRSRSLKRPPQLPEPNLKQEDERRIVISALRRLWLFVSGLYRRAGYAEDAAMAVEEAWGLVGPDGDGEADVFVERGWLALAQGKKETAMGYFDAAIAVDFNHPAAIIGLSQILLEVPAVSSATPSIRPSTTSLQQPAAPLPQQVLPKSKEQAEEALLSSLALANRALGLLVHLTNSGRGWDIPEAWFALATAYELSGELEKAKHALWKCVELEDSRGVRAWAAVRPRIL
ncbi:hypothetical protein RUND412_003014 [Rhizina undulata]